MNIQLDCRRDGGIALYIDGDLQFDSTDEAIYHESLVLPALTLAASRAADHPLRVLICGGGDGLALRESLRFPNVGTLDLVDASNEILAIGRNELRGLNHCAFEDRRVRVHRADAWQWLQEGARYDAIICDFTVPRKDADAQIVSREWYSRLARAVGAHGIVAINGASPDTSPDAFACQWRTIRSSGLRCVPYRACIPSFRAAGYGAWSFFLASAGPLSIADLRAMRCPVPTRQADIRALWRGATFSRSVRQAAADAPLCTLTNPCLPRLAHSARGQALVPFDLSGLVDAIPSTHAGHTREMIEAMAENVMGAIGGIDMERLVSELLRRASQLPEQLRRELLRLRDYLRQTASRLEWASEWGRRLVAALILIMTLANLVAPESAFAKGAHGLGHASVSRGYAASFGHAGTGSFGRSGSFRSGSFGGTAGLRSGSFSHEGATHGRGFAQSYGNRSITDIYGYSYPGHTYYYGGRRGSGHSRLAPVPHNAVFAAEDDTTVLDNGDITITLSSASYLLLSNGHVSLMSTRQPAPLAAMYVDPALIERLSRVLSDRLAQARMDARSRRDWLDWVGWTSALMPSVRTEQLEHSHLLDLCRRLERAIAALPDPAASPSASPPPSSAVELFDSAFVLASGALWLYTETGQPAVIRGPTLTPPMGKPHPVPAELRAVLISTAGKLVDELNADIRADTTDLSQAVRAEQQLRQDLAQYEAIRRSSGGSYTVDYGTDEMSASDAIARTERDLAQSAAGIAALQSGIEKNARDLAGLRAFIGG